MGGENTGRENIKPYVKHEHYDIVRKQAQTNATEKILT